LSDPFVLMFVRRTIESAARDPRATNAFGAPTRRRRWRSMAA
jgi:hypothetical protein